METEVLNINGIQGPLEDEHMLLMKDDIMREDIEKLESRIEAAENVYQIHNQARSKISEEIMGRKMDRDRITSELEYLSYPRRGSYRSTIKWKNDEIKQLQCILYDLDRRKKVTPLHYRVKHCSNTRAKERQLVREIRDSEASAKLLADTAVQATMTNHFSSEEAVETTIKCLAIRRDGLQRLYRELEVIQNDIRCLQTKLASVNQKKSLAYRTILELKRQRAP